MKTSVVQNLFLVLLLLTIISNSKSSFAQSYADIIVPDDYTSIQEAIDAAEPNQYIFVRSNVYREYLLINKTIHLIGENTSTTIIEGNGSKVLIEVLADNVTISGFSVRNAETGLLLKNVGNCRIEKNSITNITITDIPTQGMGIYANGCENISITENFARDIYFNAVFLMNTDRSVIAKNVFSANMRMSQPVFLYSSDGNLVTMNDVLGEADMNEGGIGLLWSNNNTISYNDIRNNDWAGISIRSSNNTFVKGNSVVNHSLWGIRIQISNNVSVYNNNFINNIVQLAVISVENLTWNHEGYGNFWGDYTGKDENKDGVGDTPYIYDDIEIDQYPLMGQFQSIEVVRENGHFLLEIISNSSLINLEYLPYVSNETITLEMSGLMDTYGFVLVKILHALLDGPYIVTVNEQNPLLFKELSSDQYITVFYIEYLHENEQESVRIIDESIPALLIMILTSIPIIMQTFYRKRQNAKKNMENSDRLTPWDSQR